MVHKDVQKIAFSVENGHYQFDRMPLRLKNAPSTFQRVMGNILLDIQNERILVYMDDLIVYCATIQEHIARHNEIFYLLRSRALRSNLINAIFLKRSRISSSFNYPR